MSPSNDSSQRVTGPKRFLAGAVAAASLVAAQADASPYSTVPIRPIPKIKKAGAVSDTVLTPSFAGFGIESSNVFAYTGTSAPNALTNQLMENLRNFTGEPPHLRIGGSTGDQMVWNSTVTAPEIVDNPDMTNDTNKWNVGPGFLSALDNLPPGTPVTMQLNLAYQGADAIQRNIDHAHAAIFDTKNITVVSFEIGNEPDRYRSQGYRPRWWTEDPGYGPEWLYRVQRINSKVLIPNNLTKTSFEPAATANPHSKDGTPFRITWLAFDSQGTGANGHGYIAGFNEHDYIYTTGATDAELTQDYLLNMNNTYDQFSGWATESAVAHKNGKPYNLREVGSVGPDGAWGISDSFSNTLWTFNFLLHAASQNVNNVNFHMTQSGSGAPWQPVTIDGHGDAHVRSPYYAIAAIDQIVGGACNVRIAQIPVVDRYVHAASLGEDAGNDRQAAYTIYTDNQISGFAFVNSMQSNASHPKNKFVNYTFTLDEVKNTEVFLSYLSAPGTDSLDNTTWNGVQYDPRTGVPGPAPATPNSNWSQSVRGDEHGAIAIPVPDGTAVVANIGSRLGSRSNIDTQACAPHRVYIHEQVQTGPSARLLAKSTLVGCIALVAAAALL